MNDLAYKKSGILRVNLNTEGGNFEQELESNDLDCPVAFSVTRQPMS